MKTENCFKGKTEIGKLSLIRSPLTFNYNSILLHRRSLHNRRLRNRHILRNRLGC